MKKVFVLVCGIAALAFASCNSGQTNAGAEGDSLATEDSVVEEVAGDATEDIQALAESIEAGDSEGFEAKVASFKEKIQKFVDEGNVEEAQKYTDAFKQFVEANKEKIEAVSPALGELATSVADNAESIVTTAVSALGSTAKDAADAVENAANDVVESGKAAVDQKVQEAKDEANAKVQAAKDNAKQKANDAIDKTANDIKGKLGLQ